MPQFEFRMLASTYHRAYPADYDPTRDEIASWERHLIKAYAEHLGRYFDEFGIGNTPWNRSLVVLLAQASNGFDYSTRTRNACIYFVAAERLATPST